MTRLRFYPDSPSIALNNLLADRQSDSRAEILVVRMKPREYSEYLTGVRGSMPMPLSRREKTHSDPSLTAELIFILLYSMFRSFKWALLILVNVMLARIGGLLALLVTHTNFSVSSGVGFLALFGVAVQTGVIMLEYINQLRVRGHTIADSAVRASGFPTIASEPPTL